MNHSKIISDTTLLMQRSYHEKRTRKGRLVIVEFTQPKMNNTCDNRIADGNRRRPLRFAQTVSEPRDKIALA